MKPLRLVIAAALVLAALPSAAFASSTQESMFQDDPLLVGTDSATKMEPTLDELKAMGVDRIRVSLFWSVVAPANDSPTRPTYFDPADSATYGPNHWEVYDRVIKAAAARGIAVNLNVTSPLPRWGSTAASPRADVQSTYSPDPDQFGKFVTAAAKRYSGTFQDLPRVDYWSIYNEPNQGGWLTPQWKADPRKPKRQIEAAPEIYRNLVRTAYQALVDNGHGADTILVGETAPKGLQRRKGLTISIDALRFIRNLYCLDDNLQIYKGSSATARGCPGSAAAFVAQNPGLFKATGYAHHPYELLLKPTKRAGWKDWVTIANLGDLSRVLKRIYARYSQPTQTGRGVPLYLTEYGYQTPPDPLGIPFARQAAYLNQAEQITYRNPLVRTLTQFLLVDDGPTPGVKNKRLAYRTFQSGLKKLNGANKPAYKAYITPLHLSKVLFHRAGSTSVFGLLRPADPALAVKVQVQFRAKGAKKWQTRKTISTKGPRHYVTTRLRITRTGIVRLAWQNGAKLVTSRPVGVTVG
jgi:hypothetical protein